MSGATWSASSTNDIAAIRTYLIERYGSDVAATILDELILSARFLADHPRVGAPLGKARWRKWRARKTPYVLVYEPAAAGVHILRARHERTDWRPVPRS